LGGTRDRAFQEFFQAHHTDLARLAWLLTGEHDAADDLVSDALLEVWRHWERVSSADSPLAYACGMVSNLARNRLRRLVRERRGLSRLGHDPGLAPAVMDSDTAAVLDVRRALRCLPYRRRACVVLRYAFDMSEQETARTLGISIGTVKSQTSRGAAQLAGLLAGSHSDLSLRPSMHSFVQFARGGNLSCGRSH
jgi:RNA polymerase sigma-70 factor (sigma-E family)